MLLRGHEFVRVFRRAVKPVARGKGGHGCGKSCRAQTRQLRPALDHVLRKGGAQIVKRGRKQYPDSA